jgi:hypothetical protein
LIHSELPGNLDSFDLETIKINVLACQSIGSFIGHHKNNMRIALFPDWTTILKNGDQQPGASEAATGT